MADIVQDRADIIDTLLNYATGIDSRDWEAFRSIWTDDLDADYGGAGRLHGADEMTAYMVQAHASMGPTWHRLSNFTVNVEGDTATSRTYFHAVLNIDKSDPDTWLDVIGHYDDQLVRTASGWKIQSRRVGRTRSVRSGAA